MRVVFEEDRCALLHGDCLEIVHVLEENSIDAFVTDPPAGIGFMGTAWDGDKGGRDQWIAWLAERLRLVLRALKPGAHALVWAIPRTSHWTAMALELAGFEVRDVHHHIFGTGFPKSLNISKAIDDHLGAEREVVGPNPNGRPNMERVEAAVLNHRVDAPITKSATPEAAQWDGFGTALKPAVEHWILARKPLSGTYAENVLAHGTGVMNIDGCRIGTEVAGRWPAHLSLEHAETCSPGACVIGCPVRLLDEQSGILKSGAHKPGERQGARDGKVLRDQKGSALGRKIESSAGGASRFFYVAKGSRSEKDAGLWHLAPKTGGEATGRAEGSAGTKNPRAGAGRTGGARNFHPTVKSIELMRWLVRLITPPGGVVLDTFAGSGTTGCAALAEGCKFVGVEQGGDDDQYIPIIEGRLRHALELSSEQVGTVARLSSE